jgi:hypothetical protein
VLDDDDGVFRVGEGADDTDEAVDVARVEPTEGSSRTKRSVDERGTEA